MHKDYYRILEVDRHASPEIIEKAYKTLVKKYHPDLQQNDLKIKYEEKLKVVNEAYEILSDREKRKNYDLLLQEDEKQKNNINLDTSSSILHSENEHFKNNNINSDIYKNQISYESQKAYYDAYIQYLKNRGYKIKYQKTFKDYFKNFIALVLTIFILFLLWQIPFIQNFLINIYEENNIIKTLFTAFFNIFK